MKVYVRMGAHVVDCIRRSHLGPLAPQQHGSDRTVRSLLVLFQTVTSTGMGKIEKTENANGST